MEYQFEISTRALAEMQEASIWYEEQSKGLGFRFLTTLQNKLQLIKHYPERYPKRVLHFRETFIKPFPYSIIYTFNKNKKRIIIASVFNNSRHPKTKFSK